MDLDEADAATGSAPHLRVVTSPSFEDVYTVTRAWCGWPTCSPDRTRPPRTGISTLDNSDGAEMAFDAATQTDGKLVVIGTVPDPDQPSVSAVGVYRFRAG